MRFLALALALMIPAGATAQNPNDILLKTPDLMQLSEAIASWDRGNKKDAKRRFEKAAEYGNNDARFSLGVMYYQGEGVERDLAKAHAWLSLAATVGSAQRIAARDQIWEMMTDDEQLRAKEVAKSMDEKYGNLAAMAKRDEWGRKQRREFTGSRVGSSTSALRIDVPTVGGATIRVSGNEYFEAMQSYVNEIRAFEYDIEYGDLQVTEESES